MRIGPHTLPLPVLLAPMAGITDLPFRRLVAGFGAGLVTSEMVASRELLTRRPSPRAGARVRMEGASAVQLAGNDPALMAEAARIAEGEGAAIIDINMGCPAKKVTGGLAGSALMREPCTALAIVAAVVGAVGVPVTLKMRLGWDDASRNAADIARRAEEAGVQAIAVHGRTRAQFYTGTADWTAIRAVVDAVRVPVTVNGDITDTASARAALAASGAAAVMVGRGAQGAPWRLAQIAAGLGLAPAPAIPQGAARADLVTAHLEEMLAFYGADLGLRVARKHLGWYLAEAGAHPRWRAEVLTAPDAAATAARLRAAFDDAPPTPADRRAA